jgi:branched-chain amino acid transport system substrate-binding protein
MVMTVFARLRGHQPRLQGNRRRATYRRRGISVTVSLATVTLVTAGCSLGASSSSAASGSSSAAAAANSPIPVGAICTTTGPITFTESCQAAQAVFNEVNASGGIHGHKIDYTYENDGSSFSTAASAGLDLIDTKNVVALVGGSNLYGCSANLAAMAKSKVYAIDGLGVDQGCWESSYNTPVNNGPLLGYLVSLEYLAVDLHIRPVCTMVNDQTSAAVKSDENAIAAFTKISGVKVKSVALWTPGANLTPLVAQWVSAGCKGVVMIGTDPVFVGFMRTAASQDLLHKITFLGLTTALSGTVASELGSTANGMYINSEFEPWPTSTIPAVNEFNRLAAKDHFLDDSTAEAGYTAATVFVKILDGINGPITRASVGAAMTAANDVSTEGLTATPFTWGQFNLSSQFLQLENGKFVKTNAEWYTVHAAASLIHDVVTSTPVSS